MSNLIKMPDLNILKNKGLLAFYEALGFDNDNDKSLDVRKVIMNTEDQKDAVRYFRSSFSDVEVKHALMLFLDKGPASNESVPKGFIKLEKGWRK